MANKKRDCQLIRIYSGPANLKKIFQNQIQEKKKKENSKQKEGPSVNQDIFRSSKCPVKSFHYQLGVQNPFLRLVSVLSTNILEH